MLLKTFNTTTHDHTNTRAFETQEAIKNLPTHHTAHMGLPSQIYTSLEPSKMPSVEKVLGVMKRLLKN